MSTDFESISSHGEENESLTEINSHNSPRTGDSGAKSSLANHETGTNHSNQDEMIVESEENGANFTNISSEIVPTLSRGNVDVEPHSTRLKVINFTEENAGIISTDTNTFPRTTVGQFPLPQNAIIVQADSLPLDHICGDSANENNDDGVFETDPAKSSHQSRLEQTIRADLSYLEGKKEEALQSLKSKSPTIHLEISSERERTKKFGYKLLDQTIEDISKAKDRHEYDRELCASGLVPLQQIIVTEKSILQMLVGEKHPTPATTSRTVEQMRKIAKCEEEYTVAERKVRMEQAKEDRRFRDQEKFIWDALKPKVMQTEAEFTAFEKEKLGELTMIKKRIGTLHILMTNKRKLLSAGVGAPNEPLRKQARGTENSEDDAFYLSEDSGVRNESTHSFD